MRYNISDRLRASFLYSDDGDDEIDEEEKDLDFIAETSPSGAPEAPEDSCDNVEKIELDADNNKDTISRAATFDFHRVSSSGFLALCDSFHGKSPHEMAASVASGVKEKFRQNLSMSLLKDYDDKDCIALFRTKEIVLGRKLGSGEFSHVYLVKSFRLDSLIDGSMSTEERGIRQYLKSREKYRDTKKSTYALKHLRPDLLDRYEPSEYAQFASDLVQEAEFLSVLQHPNIIKLRGTSFVGFNGFEQGPKGYFLIIDRLEETLVDRITKWKRGTKPGRRSSWLVGKSINRKDSDDEDDGSSSKKILSQQLEVVLQIAAAMLYLHEKNIIFRDLKPANVGFDVRGDVKLFDFGLAKMMSPTGNSYNDQYVMSGAGSPRYMAPEVLNGEPTYNLKADVYTFGMVLWEVLALEKPLAFIRSMDMLVDYVINDGGHPDIKDDWPTSIQDILRMSFDASPDERPSMKFIFDAIRSELCHLRGGDNSRLQISYLLRRRSMDSVIDWQGDSDETNPRRTRNKLRSSLVKFGRKFSM